MKMNIDAPLLQIRNLSVKAGKRNIIQDVSLSFSPGLYFIGGLNGSGKTTLLRAISGLVSYKGIICWNEKDLSEFSEKERARLIAVVPQKFFPIFDISVFDFILMGRFHNLGWLGNYSLKDKEEVLAVSREWGIEELEQKKLSILSGGEMQKVLIARAQYQGSRAILLDEPEQSLDWNGKILFAEALEKLRQLGKIIICTTHEKSLFLTPGSRVIGISGGKISWNGEWNETAPEAIFGVKE